MYLKGNIKKQISAQTQYICKLHYIGSEFIFKNTDIVTWDTYSWDLCIFFVLVCVLALVFMGTMVSIASRICQILTQTKTVNYKCVQVTSAVPHGTSHKHKSFQQIWNKGEKHLFFLKFQMGTPSKCILPSNRLESWKASIFQFLLQKSYWTM